ncbi:MAG: ADP-ribosylglycohydrolase family protein [Pseudomonadota bacterium]
MFIEDTVVGQLTDDSEMAIALLRSCFTTAPDNTPKFIGYDVDRATDAYCDWMYSQPIDCGNTTRKGLMGQPDDDSEANGALMRASSLGIVSTQVDADTGSEWARLDAAITHPNEHCQQANVLYVLSIRHALLTDGITPEQLIDYAQTVCATYQLNQLETTLTTSQQSPYPDHYGFMGWVKIALHNAFYQLTHARCFKDALNDTIARGGDTDTNACIAGALYGAVVGVEQITNSWLISVQHAKPPTRSDNLHAAFGAKLIDTL